MTADKSLAQAENTNSKSTAAEQPNSGHSAMADFAAGLSSHLKAPIVGAIQTVSGNLYDAEAAHKQPVAETKSRMAGEMLADAVVFLGTTAVIKRFQATGALSAYAAIEAGAALGFVAPLKNGEGFSQRLVHATGGAATMAIIEKSPKVLAATGLVKTAETTVGGAITSGALVGAMTEQVNSVSRTGHFADWKQTAVAAGSFGLTAGAFHGAGLLLADRATKYGERSRLQDLASIVPSMPKIENFFAKKESQTEGWHLVLGSGGSKAALTGAGVVLAARAASLKIDTIGGVSGGFVPAALASTDMSSAQLLKVARDTDIAALVTQRPIFKQVIHDHVRPDLLKDGLYDTSPLGEMVQGHMPDQKWPEKLWTMAVGADHSEVVFTSKGVTEYTAERGRNVLSSDQPHVGDAARATSAIPGVLASMTMFGRRLYDGALGKFGKCPTDMASAHLGASPERIIASLPTGAMTATNQRLYRFAKYLSGHSEHSAQQYVEHAGIVVRPEVNSFHSLRFSLLPAQREEAILAGYRAALEEFAKSELIGGTDLALARSAGSSMGALETYFAPKPRFPFLRSDILLLTGPKIAAKTEAIGHALADAVGKAS